MKKLFAIMVIAAAFTSCTDNTNADENTKDTTIVMPAPVEPSTTDTTVIKEDTASKTADTTIVK